MYLCSWTINHGHNELQDFAIIMDDVAEVNAWTAEIQTVDDVYCWAACRILEASEPHWIESR